MFWLVLILLDLIAGVAEYISACQTYEGGFGGEPGNEAHGGYTFCSIATLLILQRVRQSYNLPSFIRVLGYSYR